MSRAKNNMRLVHPGEVLREEFLVPLGLSNNRLAQALGIPTNRVSEITAERRNVTADTALRLARVFGTSAAFCLNLQTSYELRQAEQALGDALLAIEPLDLAALAAC